MTLSDLQKLLKKHKLDAFLVSRNNLFLNQDVRDDENLIMQLTGFSGSAGTLLIMPEKNILFIDGRYALQAPQEVDSKKVEIVCTSQTSLHTWINQNLKNKKVGYNPWCWNINDILAFDAPEMKPETNFLPVSQTTKPANIFEHEIEFCGQSREEKITLLSQYLIEKNLQAYFISASDSVSWLLNLRSDILPETPIFRAFALVDSKRHIWVFADNIKPGHLAEKITFLSFSELPARLKKFKKQNVGADFNQTSAALYAVAKEYNLYLKHIPDFCQERKAIKNSCELQGIRNAHLRDGVAVCKFLYWLEQNWQGKTELDIVHKLHEYRSKQTNYISESFTTIAATGSNGAIVHYTPTTQSNKQLEADNLLLIDSGAQYLDGTTDITRTIALGNISPEMSDDFTLVLKAHINLSSAIFPEKTTGARLDALARTVLWKEGKNYDHGTGHGVGCFLNVHEGPQYISSKCNQPFVSGLVSSIEPGYYLENKYGIRIENLVEVSASEYPNFLCFKNLTLVPIDKRAINKYLLNDEEITWLNIYHQEIFEKISPYLNSTEKEWLKTACSPL